MNRLVKTVIKLWLVKKVIGLFSHKNEEVKVKRGTMKHA
jgi:hypothetical protein